MPFIGQTPTPVPLTTSDVTDGIITNAKLAQDIISADTALGATPADTDEFLVSDAGTLKRMDYSHIKPAAGGAWTKIKTITLDGSSTSTVDFVHGTSDVIFDDTYQIYKVFIKGLTGYSGNTDMFMRFFDGGTDGTGTSIADGSQTYHGVVHVVDVSGNHNVNYDTNASKIFGNYGYIDDNTGTGLSYEVTIHNTEDVAANDVFHHLTVIGMMSETTIANGYMAQHFMGGGHWKTATNKVRGIRFLTTAGTFATGKFVLYGIA